ncbi:DUF2007 domain-containing protein [Cohaesibacter celericrescens]|uniref:DUF2007 domain-containing protein n=1 Tax=Cohaesibacter celericrescens TaxID=2067669 RepID=A0A2N5XKY7_9HYPH|nr:DUF2007 domain-containing protein [Cohaesibacter celericrescens]PLW75090.1 hypothetical protein C0081_22650 [Cohaesibacter celericrescens]
MKELLKTNNMVTLSFVEALLRDAEIPFQSLDHHMSIMDGSLGVLPRRILVAEDFEIRARRLLVDAGLEGEAEEPKDK